MPNFPLNTGHASIIYSAHKQSRTEINTVRYPTVTDNIVEEELLQLDYTSIADIQTDGWTQHLQHSATTTTTTTSGNNESKCIFAAVLSLNSGFNQSINQLIRRGLE